MNDDSHQSNLSDNGVERVSQPDKQGETHNENFTNDSKQGIEHYKQIEVEAEEHRNSQNSTQNGDQFFIGRHFGNIIYNSPEYRIHKEDPASTYLLDSAEQCATFFEQRCSSRYMAYAIALALYDILLVSDVKRLTEGLQSSLPLLIDCEKNDMARFEEQYLSQDRILSTIHAEKGKVIIKDDQFGETVCDVLRYQGVTMSQDVYRNIWSQFPNLHSTIVTWLLSSLENSSSFMWRGTIDALARIVINDFPYGYNAIIVKLLQSEKCLYTLANIAGLLLQNDLTRNSIEKILKQWAFEQHEWHWKILLLIYIWNIEGEYRELLHDLIHRKISQSYYQKQTKVTDIGFLGEKLVASEAIRNYACEEIFNLFQIYNCDKARVFDIYLTMIIYSIGLLWEKRSNLPLVCCDKNEQHEWLKPLYYYIPRNYNIWKTWCWVMSKYIKKVDKWSIPHDSLNRFCVWMAYGGTFDMKCMRTFLSDRSMRDSPTAQSILNILQSLQRDA